MCSRFLTTLIGSTAFLTCSAAAAPFDPAGTWTLTDAYEIHADGSRSTNYGEHPHGLLIVDAVSSVIAFSLTSSASSSSMASGRVRFGK